MEAVIPYALSILAAMAVLTTFGVTAIAMHLVMGAEKDGKKDRP